MLGVLHGLLEDLVEVRHLAVHVGHQPALLHVGVRVVLALLADSVHVFVPLLEGDARHFVHGLGHRGREEKGLPLRRQGLDDLGDGGPEPHLEQPVRLVEDQGAKVAHAPAQVPILEVVDQPTRRGDEHVAAVPLEVVGLRVHVGPPDDVLAVVVVEGEDLLRLLVDLEHELAGGGNDEDGDVVTVAGGGVLDKALDSRDEEGDGLAGACLGLGKHVLPPEDRGQRGGLHVGHVREPEALIHGALGVVRDGEGVEGLIGEVLLEPLRHGRGNPRALRRRGPGRGRATVAVHAAGTTAATAATPAATPAAALGVTRGTRGARGRAILSHGSSNSHP
mmetsp:Transcript_43720/g.139349  ORF Transcript_43720/g.139349 Transcript_43720/m.139349 type:complete len:335 (-) Transcript_43720:321-1325(-)